MKKTKRQMQAEIDKLKERVAALEIRVHCLEIANTCHKYIDIGGNWPYKEPERREKNWWYNNPTCKTSYSTREFI